MTINITPLLLKDILKQNLTFQKNGMKIYFTGENYLFMTLLRAKEKQD
jgi:hypothetical protein